MYKNKLTDIIKVVKCLEEAEEDWIWLREIGRRCDLSHTTVSRLIDKHLTDFVEIQTMEPFNLKMVKLKDDVDLDGILRYLATKRKIEEMESKLKGIGSKEKHSVTRK